MVAKKKREVVKIKLANYVDKKSLKSFKPDLQKISDEITTTNFLPPLPGLEKAKESLSFFEEDIPITTGYGMIKDYSVILDCVAAVAMATGFIMVGLALGMMR